MNCFQRLAWARQRCAETWQHWNDRLTVPASSSQTMVQRSRRQNSTILCSLTLVPAFVGITGPNAPQVDVCTRDITLTEADGLSSLALLPRWLPGHLTTTDEIGYDRISGAVAQLGERRVRNAKVRGSIPLGSTIFPQLGRPSNLSRFFLQDRRISVGTCWTTDRAFSAAKAIPSGTFGGLP